MNGFETVEKACAKHRLPRALVPLAAAFALMTGCGGANDEPADTTAAEERMTALAAAPARFKHPGIFMTQTRLDTFKAAANSPNASAMKTGYAVILADARSAYTYSHLALSTVQVVGGASGWQEARFKNDAMAAYLNTLRWVKTGDARHRDKAMQILDDWANTFRSFNVASGTNSAQTQLEAAWMMPVWISAAEILRHHGGGLAQWSPAEVARFDGFVDRLYNEASQARTRVNNWAVSAALAMMAAGVYQDDPGRYAQGLTRLIEMIPLSVYANGEVNELQSRDCWHPQYNLIGLAQGAEMATIQGDTSVWLHKPWSSDATPRLALGLEYMARSLLYGSGVRDCRGSHLEAGYIDIAANGYMNRGLPIPNFQALAKAHRPDVGSYVFLGWTTATHGRDDY
jgi:Alginate lyase